VNPATAVLDEAIALRANFRRASGFVQIAIAMTRSERQRLIATVG
jgi:hypothetical protein